MNEQKEVDFKQLDEAAVALESFSDDLRHQFREGGFKGFEKDIAHTRWNHLSSTFGLESKHDGSSGLDFAKRVALGTQSRFGKFIESVKIFFDHSGAKEVERMRRMAKEVRGDGEGVFVDAKLASRLQVKGDLPKSYSAQVNAMVKLSDYVSQHVVPEISRLIHDVVSIIGPSYPRTSEEFHDDLMKMVQKTVAFKLPMDQFTEEQFNALFPGGRAPFEERRSQAIGTTNKKITDKPTLRVFSIVNETKYRVKNGAAQVSGTAYNSRLPVLNRQQVEEMIDNCEKLSELIRRLIEIGKHHGHDYTGPYVANCLVATMEFMQGELIEDEDDEDVVHDTAVSVDSDDRSRVAALEGYYNLTLVNHRHLLETFTRIAIEMHKSFSSYVHASLKQYK